MFEIETSKMNDTSKTELERLAPKRFPKLAARDVFEVVVIDDVFDFILLTQKQIRTWTDHEYVEQLLDG